MVHRRVQESSRLRYSEKVDDGADAGHQWSGSITGGRIEPLALCRIEAQEGGVAVDGVPLSPRGGAGILQAHWRSTAEEVGMAGYGAGEQQVRQGFSRSTRASGTVAAGAGVGGDRDYHFRTWRA